MSELEIQPSDVIAQLSLRHVAQSLRGFHFHDDPPLDEQVDAMLAHDGSMEVNINWVLAFDQ